VPDREIVCNYYHSASCQESPKYTKDNMKDWNIHTADDRGFFNGKTIRKVYGVRWPCCEDMSGEFGIKWHIARDGDGPYAFKCWTRSKQKGLVTEKNPAPV
jgi:hypothetical protein